MNANSIAQRIEHLFEPAARAARRGDASQIRGLLDELHDIWKRNKRRKGTDDSADIARGMTYALEGVLGIVLAGASADARLTLVHGRKHALPVLHVLGRRAREVVRNPPGSEATSAGDLAAMRMGELADQVGARAQNISELVSAMSECGLVMVSDVGTARQVRITNLGAEVLETCKPGWQLLEVDNEALTKRLEEEVRSTMKAIEAMCRPAVGAADPTEGTFDLVFQDLDVGQDPSPLVHLNAESKYRVITTWGQGFRKKRAKPLQLHGRLQDPIQLGAMRSWAKSNE